MWQGRVRKGQDFLKQLSFAFSLQDGVCDLGVIMEIPLKDLLEERINENIICRSFHTNQSTTLLLSSKDQHGLGGGYVYAAMVNFCLLLGAKCVVRAEGSSLQES